MNVQTGGSEPFPTWLSSLWAPLQAASADAAQDPLVDAERLAAIAALGADDTEHVQSLTGDLASGVARDLGAPIALVNVLLSGAQLMVGAHGLAGWTAETRAVPAEWSFCAPVVRSGLSRVIPDMAADADTAENPLHVIDGVRSYAGVPMRTSSGHVIGSVCVLDGEPRDFTDADLEVLRRTAEQVVARLEGSARTSGGTGSGPAPVALG